MALSTIHTALMYARFNLTQDPSIEAGKTYYVKKEGVYEAVANPVAESLSTYYERGEMQKLICIKDYPDMGGTPEQIEATTLCDEKTTYVEGVQSTSALTYTANYSKEDFNVLKGLKGEVVQFGLWFGADSDNNPDGHDGKFEYQGTLNVFVSGKGVNEVREISITTTPNTEVEMVE